MNTPRNLQGFSKNRISILVPTLLAILILAAFTAPAADKVDPNEPALVNPGPVGGPPSDAIVLFDGSDLSHWKSDKGGEAKWKLVDGAMEVTGTGSIQTKQEFGDVQLHVEWATPKEIQGSGQGRGNSGVYLQGRYEIQVLDSYNNKTYFNGQAGSFYGNFAPLVNASRPPGEWQTYDIIFQAPRPGKDDKKVLPGNFTVFHNGVLIQNHVPIKGPSTASQLKGTSAKGPLTLQDHGNPVRYRNIWIRPLN